MSKYCNLWVTRIWMNVFFLLIKQLKISDKVKITVIYALHRYIDITAFMCFTVIKGTQCVHNIGPSSLSRRHACDNANTS